jgi:tetratricopeptide (TPR) repeat protein
LPRTIQPFYLRTSSILEFLLILLLLTAIPGCVVGDFIGVYFNTYYNVQRLFSEAEDEVWALPETKSSGKNLLVQYTLPTATKTKFTSVIEKCSKLLQYHPDSRYVDDALLIIAKSYYYSGEYQKTERKCRELIDGFPESDLMLETKLLLASAQYKMGNKGDAGDRAKEVLELASKEKEEGIQARASLVLAAIDLDNKNYAEAQTQFQRAGELGDNADLRSSTLLSAAEMFVLIQDFAGAEQAYRKALVASANYTGEYRAKIGIARMLGRQKRYEDALKALGELRGNLNFKEFFGEIEFETGNAYRDMGDLDGAVRQYRKVDTSYARTEASANSYYQLGLLYETRLSLYDSARVAYNKGRVEFPQAGITPQMGRRGDYLNRYSQFRGDIAKYDSLRTVLLSANDSSARKSDTVAAKQSTPADSLKRFMPKQVPATMSLDSVNMRLAAAKNELATLFYATIGRPDSALYWYRRVIDDHPTSIFIPRALFTVGQIFVQDSLASRATVDSLYREVVNRYPESVFADESRRLLGLPPRQQLVDPADALYAGAEILMSGGNAPAAIDTLTGLVHRYPSASIAPKAQYFIGWLYENVTVQPESAFVNYDRLVRLYPASQFSQRVQARVTDPDVRARLAPGEAKKDTVSAAMPGKAPANQVTPNPTVPTDDKSGGKRGRQPEEPSGVPGRGEDQPKEKIPK